MSGPILPRNTPKKGTTVPSLDSFKCKKTLKVGSKTYVYFSLTAAEKNGLKGISRLPNSLKILLENLLRHEDGRTVSADDIKAVAGWLKKRSSDREIAFRPARVLMQDFTGVPAVVDLAAMRDAMKAMKGDPEKINPLTPVDLVIDHSVTVDFFTGKDAFKKNVAMEYERNGERYSFLRWGQQGFDRFRVVPPGTGICHQVNLEYLAQTVWSDKVKEGKKTVEYAYPDTLVGTDSHTTMINGLSVLGWGVGGIEAEAAMLGQPISMLIPEVIGMRFSGKLRAGVTATDLVLTVTQMLRKKGVVGKFVEFYGEGLAAMPLEDRATIGNMAPEYGATCGFFPIDAETLRYHEGDGPQHRASCARREIRKGARPLPHGEERGAGVHRHAPARPFNGRAQPCRPAPAAGSRRALQCRCGVRQGAGRRLQEGRRSQETRADRRHAAHAQSRRCRARGHHLVHQHLQPLCHAGRRTSRAQRDQARLAGEALGEDLARAGQPGRRRLSRAFRSRQAARAARLQHRRLWLHHLHRQFRTAAGECRQGGE